jgi:hypothetical protein
MQIIGQPQAITQIDSLQIGNQDFKDMIVFGDALFRKKRSHQPINLDLGAITQKFNCAFHQASIMPPSLLFSIPAKVAAMVGRLGICIVSRILLEKKILSF